MAIVNNPHTIEDIDRKYTSWSKLVKPKGFVYKNTLLGTRTTYFASNWWPTTTEGNIDKATPLKQSMFNHIKTHFFDPHPDIDDGSFIRLLFKNDDKKYFFSIHIFTADELSKPDNLDKDILLNDGLFEIRILDKNDSTANVVDSLKINCDLNTNYGHRINDINVNASVLPEKFIIGCYNHITQESFMIESDRIYPLDTVLYLSVYGLLGDFVNLLTNPRNIDSITPNMVSLFDDTKVDERATLISTDMIKVPKASNEELYFSKNYRNGVMIFDLPNPNTITNLINQFGGYTYPFTSNYPKLKDFTLFTKFRLNTEFMNIIVGPFFGSRNYRQFDSDQITTIDMNSIRFDNCKHVIALFGSMHGLKNIINFKFNGANKIESINSMFADCLGIENIDISNWDLPSTCKNLDGFFSIRISPDQGISNSNTNNIKTITLPTDFERRVANVESFRSVFSGNRGLTTINNLSLNMPKCKTFYCLFDNCGSLTNVNLSNITVTDKEPVDLYCMFNWCSKLSGTIDLSKIKYIKSLKYTFNSTGNNGSLSSIKFAPGVLNTSANPPEKKMDKDALVSTFFQTKVNSIEHLEDLNAPEIESMKNTFTNLSGIRDLNLPNFKMEGVKSLEGTFKGSSDSLRNIRLPKVEKLNPDITTMKDMFSLCFNLETIDFPPLTKQNNPQNTKKLTDLSGLLSNCRNLRTSIYITNLDTSNVTTLEGAFATFNNQGIDIIGIEDLNVSNVTNFNNTFGGNIKNKPVLDLRKWNVSKGTRFYSIFSRISSEINITGWDISKLVYARGLFANMTIDRLDKIKGIDTLDFSSVKSGNPCYNESLDTFNPEYIMSEFGGIDSMFSGMNNLINLTIPTSLKNLPNITSLYSFLEACYKLQTADFTGCHYGTIKNIGRLCDLDYELRTIDLTALDLNIRCGAFAFTKCYNLREIKGTLVFDPSITENESKYLLKDMFRECNSLYNLKVKNIPNNNKALFESVTGIRGNQYTVVS